MKKNTYIIICEGSSETAYIQELNKYMRENDINLNLYPKSIGNGHYAEIIKKYKKEYSSNKKSKFIIWIDKDIYIRNENGNMDKYLSKPTNIPDFKFNMCNFEDFIVLHCDDTTIYNWQNICNNKNHFKVPLQACNYEPLFENNVINNYEKGSFPFNEINKELLDKAIENNNNKNIKFKSDFLSFLENEIKNNV